MAVNVSPNAPFALKGFMRITATHLKKSHLILNNKNNIYIFKYFKIQA